MIGLVPRPCSPDPSSDGGWRRGTGGGRASHAPVVSVAHGWPQIGSGRLCFQDAVHASKRSCSLPAYGSQPVASAGTSGMHASLGGGLIMHTAKHRDGMSARAACRRRASQADSLNGIRGVIIIQGREIYWRNPLFSGRLPLHAPQPQSRSVSDHVPVIISM